MGVDERRGEQNREGKESEEEMGREVGVGGCCLLKQQSRKRRQ